MKNYFFMLLLVNAVSGGIDLTVKFTLWYILGFIAVIMVIIFLAQKKRRWK